MTTRPQSDTSADVRALHDLDDAAAHPGLEVVIGEPVERLPDRRGLPDSPLLETERPVRPMPTSAAASRS